jgi:hypothetical protein
MSETPTARLRDATPLSQGAVGHRVAQIANGALAATCLVAIVALLEVDPLRLDQHTRLAPWCLSVALPVLAATALLRAANRVRVFSALLILLGTGALAAAIGLVLSDLHTTAWMRTFVLYWVAYAGLTVWWARELLRARSVFRQQPHPGTK